MVFQTFSLSLQSQPNSGWRNIEESYQALARQRIWKIQSSRAKSGGRSSCVGITGANLYLGPNYTSAGVSRFSFFMLQVFQNLLTGNVKRLTLFVYEILLT